MSLTSVLHYGNKEFKDFRTSLVDLFPTPIISSESLIISAPLTANYALVGIAFDYLLRFSLEKKYKELVYSSNWIAEDALQNYKGNRFSINGEISIDDYDKLDDLMLIWAEDHKKVNQRFRDSKLIYGEFINTSIGVSDALLETVLFLSRLDLVARDNLHNELSLNPEHKDDLTDLRTLILNCDLNLFKPYSKIVLNPTFGKGSKLVNGADADLIIDNTLIEIKTTKHLKITRPIFNQLLGYYLLYIIGGVDKHKDCIIENLGIYFSRYNLLWSIPIAQIGDRADFNKAAKFLKKTNR